MTMTGITTSIRVRPIRNGIIAGSVILVILLSRAQLTEWVAYLTAHPLAVRTVALLFTVLCGALIGLCVVAAVPTVAAFRHHVTWRVTWRSMNRWMIGFSLIGLLVLTAISAGAVERTMLLASFATVPPLIALITGLQAALVISLEDDPTIELPLTYARPFAWLVAERALLGLTAQLVIGVVVTLLAAAMQAGELATLLLRWLPPTILLWGVGLRMSIGTRQVVFGAMLVIGLWYVLYNFGVPLLLQYPFLWPVSPFLTLDHPLFALPALLTDGDYALNRTLITVLGMVLAMSALYELRDDEWVLTGRQAIQRSRLRGEE